MGGRYRFISYVPDLLFFGSMISAYFLDRYFPLVEVMRTPFNYIGGVLAVAGCFFVVRSIAALKSKRASTDVARTSEVLITDGLYSYSRNPLYAAELIAIVGVAVMCGSFSVWIGPVAYAVVLNLYVIPFEERNLQNKFDQSYEEYRHKVRRWL